MCYTIFMPTTRKTSLRVRPRINTEPLRAAKRNAGLTDAQLATAAGCHWTTISRNLNGRKPSREVLQWLADRFEIPIEEIIPEECEKSSLTA
jgi:transcriptional regulator with XRE-family HTH domain